LPPPPVKQQIRLRHFQPAQIEHLIGLPKYLKSPHRPRSLNHGDGGCPDCFVEFFVPRAKLGGRKPILKINGALRIHIS